MNFRRLSVNGLLIVIALMISANASFSEPQKTWKPLINLGPQELELYDPSQNTPRDASIPYIPAEKYPLAHLILLKKWVIGTPNSLTSIDGRIL